MPKMGNRTQTANYRPIYLVSIFSEVMEIANKIQLIKFLKNYDVNNDSMVLKRNAPPETCYFKSLESGFGYI